jgi:hypothetical protein
MCAYPWWSSRTGWAALRNCHRNGREPWKNDGQMMMMMMRMRMRINDDEEEDEDENEL